MNTEKLKQLLEDVRDGSINVHEATEILRHLPFEDLGFAKVDHHRGIRCGYPEVIYCPGKTTEQITEIFAKLAGGGGNIIASRAVQEVYQALAETEKYPGLIYNQTARTVVYAQQEIEFIPGYIAVVTGGTSDLSVATEAKVIAETMGVRVELICDVGVAGLHRLLPHIGTIQQANVVIAVAGMEGALASVVGGMVDCPVIAVPTSVGYGSNFDGLSALLAMLNSCASGVTVVNIDNGFGAGFTAAIINYKINQGGGDGKDH